MDESFASRYFLQKSESKARRYDATNAIVMTGLSERAHEQMDVTFRMTNEPRLEWGQKTSDKSITVAGIMNRMPGMLA